MVRLIIVLTITHVRLGYLSQRLSFHAGFPCNFFWELALITDMINNSLYDIPASSSPSDPFAPPARKLVDFGLAQFSCDVCGEWFTPVSQVVFSPLRYRFIDYVQALLQLILSILSKCYTGPRLHDFCWQSQPKMPSNGRTKLSRSYCRTLYIFCRDDEVAPESTSATAKPRRLFEAGDGVNVFAEPAVMNR